MPHGGVGRPQRGLGCGQQRISYNSCRNRHCPKCQAATRAEWLRREAGWLLPVEYHHVVFTLPGAVAPLALQNPRRLYGLLFAAAWETVRELALDPHYLGAEVGMVAVLHTWGQTLRHHPHLHCVVTGGGLACDASGESSTGAVGGVPAGLLPTGARPEPAVSRQVAGGAAGGARGRLTRLSWPVGGAGGPDDVAAWLTPLYQQEWVVYAKPPWGGPESVLKYLARYTHRVAISNSRLVSLDDGQVACVTRTTRRISGRRR